MMKKSTRVSKKLSALLFSEFIKTKAGVDTLHHFFYVVKKSLLLILLLAVHKLAFAIGEEGFQLVAS